MVISFARISGTEVKAAVPSPASRRAVRRRWVVAGGAGRGEGGDLFWEDFGYGGQGGGSKPGFKEGSQEPLRVVRGCLNEDIEIEGGSRHSVEHGRDASDHDVLHLMCLKALEHDPKTVEHSSFFPEPRGWPPGSGSSAHRTDPCGLPGRETGTRAPWLREFPPCGHKRRRAS